MKTYLITGGCGFIGSNFIHHLIENKLAGEIINLDKMTYAGNKDNLSTIEGNDYYHFIEGDICNRNTVNEILMKHNPDVVIHFAAESHVDRSIDAPTKFIQTNVVGTLNLLNESNEWLKNLDGIKKDSFRFIHISTDEVYGSLGKTGKFLETTSYDPSSPYSASKASSDHLARAWHRTFDFPVIITNCSNNYGPFQFPEKLIPLTIINSLTGKNLPVYGSGTNVRDWLYVRDHCEAIQTVVDKGELGETYNIGGDNEISNLDLVSTIIEILKSKYDLNPQIKFVTDRKGHDRRYAIDMTKTSNLLGELPKNTFEENLASTIDWYIQNYDWWDE